MNYYMIIRVLRRRILSVEEDGETILSIYLSMDQYQKSKAKNENERERRGWWNGWELLLD
jgi:hypothetical protein